MPLRLALAKPRADPDGLLAELPAHLTPYPVALRQALMDDLWVADFHLVAARKGVVRRDSVYVATCLSDALLVTAHAVHGLAGGWATNEKGLVAAAGCLPNAPHGFAERCQQAMHCLQPESLGLAVDRAATIVVEVLAGAGELRSPADINWESPTSSTTCTSPRPSRRAVTESTDAAQGRTVTTTLSAASPGVARPEPDASGGARRT